MSVDIGALNTYLSTRDPSPVQNEKHTRKITHDDLGLILTLCQERNYQRLISEYNDVDQITGSLDELNTLFKEAVDSNVPKIAMFIFRKFSYDDKAKVLLWMDYPLHDREVKDYICGWVVEFIRDDEYVDQFTKFIKLGMSIHRSFEL